MTRAWWAIVVFVLAAVAPALATTAAAEATPRDVEAQRTVVVLSGGASVRRYLREHGITPVFTYKAIFKGFAADLSTDQRAALRQEGQVDGVALSRVLRRPPLTGREARLDAPRQSATRVADSPRVLREGEGAACGQVVTNAVRRIGALESPTATPNDVRRRLLADAEPGPIPQDPDGVFEGILSVRGS